MKKRVIFLRIENISIYSFKIKTLMCTEEHKLLYNNKKHEISCKIEKFIV
jgi:hypothetical protein